MVLGTICILVALILASINMVTGPIIKKMEEQKVYDSLREALDGEFAPVEIPAGAPDTVTGIYKVTENGEAVGHVVTVEKQGYASTIVLTVGIKADGTVNRVVVTSQQETHGKDIKPLINGFAGVNEDGVADVEQVTGATITSKTVKEAVADAFKALSADAGDNGGEEEEEETLPRTDAEIEALAKEFAGEDTQLESVAVENTTNVKRVYRVSGNKGYIAYLVVMSQYGTVETETIVHVENNGKIKDINKLIWKTSDAMYGYIPPETALVDAFYESLKGKSVSELEELKLLDDDNDETSHGGLLVTQGTKTSGRLLGSLIEAITYIEEIIKKDMPTSEEQLFAYGKDMIAEDAEFTDITPDSISFIKKIYRENKGRGYLAYLVVISERYNRIETETLVCVGNDGIIKDVEKIIWRPSDAGWGYEPPTDDVVNPFYESLKGKSLADLQTLVALEEGKHDGQLVTNATTTSKTLLTALIEGVSAIDDARKKDMPRSEADVLALAQQMAGEGKALTNVTPGGVQFLKRLYRIDDSNNYIAYVVVINERYGRVETETLIYITDNGILKDINKLTWRPSDAGWGYVPPEESVVDAFYARLKGKTISELKELLALESNEDGILVTNATTTSKALLSALTEAFDSSKSLNIAIEESVNNTPRAVGIAVAVAMAVGIAAAIALPIITKRRKNG